MRAVTASMMIMPMLKGRKHSRFTGNVALRRWGTPPLQRKVLIWEYAEPYRLGRAVIWHVPGIRRSWMRGRWDDRSAKDYDDHEAIQRHLLNAMQGRARGYFIGEDGQIDPIGEQGLVR